MYGLIHSALQQLIIDEHGNDKWAEILAVANVPEDSFFSTQSYEDEVTFSLVGATATVLDVSVDQCLEVFGEYWLAKFSPQSYDMLLQAAGDNLFEFLENLDSLHDRISTTFVGYVPPSFQLERHDETHARLEYRSSRHGMVPFVIGIIKGMQERFDVDIKVNGVEVNSDDTGVRALIDLEVVAR